MGDTEPELANFWNQESPQVEGLEHQSSHKTFNIQFVLPAECSVTGASHSHHQKDQNDFLQQLIGADPQSHSQN